MGEENGAGESRAWQIGSDNGTEKEQQTGSAIYKVV